ncbi:hypothetical protein JCGZ_03599 [Jatropha curcas]|uniref:Uncharacterized protein n=1 Tax=Jatropha curcas TaxID=180498 RepID=A0A067JD34_JATCU|nr:hypothetical protein JCGZ_03599 [Jatropha curcas]
MREMYGSYTAATFINLPHRGQEHQIVQITLGEYFWFLTGIPDWGQKYDLLP